MHAPAAPTSTRPSMTLAQRIAFPTPAARQARADVKRFYQLRRAQSELRKMHERMAALLSDQNALRQLTEVAEQAAPAKIEESSWHGDIPELADKIRREELGLLEATEAPVRAKDRELVLKGLPPGIEVNRDDPTRY